MRIEERMSVVLCDFARTLGADFSIQAILDQLVLSVVEVLPIDGAGVTLMSPSAEPRYVAASNRLALRCERLQVAAGEGPCFAAYETGEPVASSDLRTEERFPTFADAALAEGVAAVLSFPLHQGDVQLGALDLYRTVAGPFDDTATAAAQTLADVTAAYLLIAQARADLEESSEQARQSSLRDDAAVLALRSSEQRKSAILASAPDAVVTIDEDGRIVEFNPAAERTFGPTEVDARGLNLAVIDRSFVASLDHDGHSAAIIRSILSLGAELGLIVVAEGIETTAQADALRAMGCSIGQGYLYGRPTPADELDLAHMHQLPRHRRHLETVGSHATLTTPRPVRGTALVVVDQPIRTATRQ